MIESRIQSGERFGGRFMKHSNPMISIERQEWLNENRIWCRKKEIWTYIDDDVANKIYDITDYRYFSFGTGFKPNPQLFYIWEHIIAL